MGDHLHEEDEFQLGYLLDEENDRFFIHDIDIEDRFNTGGITVEEIKRAIRTMANNKSGGIENCKAEILKCLDKGNLGEIADILTEYWRHKFVPDEMTKARVVSLCKKGNPRMQANYRLISLLNALYKLYAKIIRNRLPIVIDDFITKTQYGFRKSRSTAQAIHVIRRIADFAEM